jgi:tetratricopeptide (TPR) repeat protein
VNPEAYNLTLQGRYSRLQNTPQGVARAIQYYRQALELDPAYAAAWAGLSRAYARQADVGLLPTAEGYRLAREAAQKALALDPESVDVLLSMAWIHATYDWDWEAADASARKALELEPGNADALRVAALLASGLGRWDDALDLSNKSIERDPLRAGTYNNLGNVLLALDRDADAEAALRKALELTPGGSSIHVQIGLALVLQGKAEAGLQEIRAEPDDTVRATGLPLALHALGRSSEADAALAALKEKYADVAAFQIAEAHAYRGEADAAFEWLDRAYSQRDGGLAGIKYSRFLRGLAGDPRYGALLRKLKLPV